MIRNFAGIFEAVARLPHKRTIAIAMAEDASVIEAVKQIDQQGIANALLVGNPEKIKTVAHRLGFKVRDAQIIAADTEEAIAREAVALVRSGRAEILMKGHISTPVLMKAVLNKESGLRKDAVLSHVAIAEVATYPKLIILSDGGINILPDLETKKAILRNAIFVAQKLGATQPKVAALCPIEKVNPKIQETVDAAELQKMAEGGEFGDIILEGPIATDVALSARAATRKELHSRIAGDTDIFLMPNITSGNAFIKILMFLANAKVGGIVVGATAPIVLLSRSDNPEEKLYSIALAILLSA